MKRLYLVRHGATDWSDAGRINGHTDVRLNERGRAQARLLQERLSRIRFDGVWSSDLRRAVETADIALGGATESGRLRELDFGGFEGKMWSEISPALQRRLVGFSGFSAPRGESVASLFNRVNDFLEGLAPGCHLLFTHGGVIRALLRATSTDQVVSPGDMVVIDVDGSLNWEARGWGERS